MGIKKHIPDTITSMNLLCGSAGVIVAFQGNPALAFYFMLAAAVCDFFDGFAARMLHACSPIGKELDSLADLVSFGLLPSVMLYRLISGAGLDVIAYVPLLLVVFSALRLAKFNIDDAQAENFIGLPTPANAMLIGSFVHYLVHTPDSIMQPWISSPVFIIVGTIVLSALMVSRIPMFSMKFKHGAKADSPVQKMRISIVAIFICCAGLIVLLGLAWSLIVMLTFVIYILINLIAALTKK